MPVETVVARNNMDSILVIGSTDDHDYVRWEAKGDPNGEDMQWVPAKLAGSPGFRKAIARQQLILDEDESDPEVVTALLKQAAAFRKREEIAKTDSNVVIDKPTNRDVVSQFCVGPNSRGNGECGESVVVPDTKKYDQAPLCTQHKHLQPEYVPEEQATLPGQDKKVSWSRVTVESNPRSNRAKK